AAAVNINGLTPGTTRSYAFGDVGGENDIAFVRLNSSITTVTPAAIYPSFPAGGAVVTFFGFGCQSYPPAGGGFKQAFSFFWGQGTSAGCPGDSGGPVVIGPETGTGPIFLTDSA